MKKFLLLLGVALCATLGANEASAQIKAGNGQVSIALESNNIYYAPDKRMVDLGLDQPDNRTRGNFGSNDYLKVDYNIGRFSAGIQVDGYLPALYGYDFYDYGQRDSKLNMFLTKYVQWEDANWGVRLGDIYDQFGNGLIFRAYEDRALAFNNSLAGARAHYSFNNMVNVKVVAGMPRLYDMRSKTAIWGADLSLSFSEMLGWYEGLVSLEASYVGRHQDVAAEYLAKYKAVKGIAAEVVNAQNLGLQGDVKVQKGDYKKAAALFEQAAAVADNNFTTPLYLKKAALAYEAAGDTAAALKTYKRIATEYAASVEARDAEKMLGQE